MVDHYDSVEEESTLKLSAIKLDDHQTAKSDGGHSDSDARDDENSGGSDSDLGSDEKGGDSSDSSGSYICDNEESSDSQSHEWNEVEGTESDSDVRKYDSDISAATALLLILRTTNREKNILCTNANSDNLRNRPVMVSRKDSALKLNDDFDPDVRKDDEGGDSDDYEGDDSDSDSDNDEKGSDSSDGSGLYICNDEESSDSEPKEWNEVEGTESDSDVPNYDSDISSDSSIIDFENDQQREEYILYKRQFRHSEGFDITDLPSFGFVGMITPVDFDSPGYFLDGCRKGLQLAIDRYNERQNADLELIKIVKSNKFAHTIYFTTFEAKSKSDVDAKTYQAKMFYDDISGKFLSYKFRQKMLLIQHPEKFKTMQDT